MIFAAYTAPSGTSTAFTADSRGATITHGAIANTSDSPVTVSVAVTRADGATAQVVSGFALPAAESLSLANYLSGAVLDQHDRIEVTADAGDAADVVISGRV